MKKYYLFLVMTLLGFVGSIASSNETTNSGVVFSDKSQCNIVVDGNETPAMYFYVSAYSVGILTQQGTLNILNQSIQNGCDVNSKTSVGLSAAHISIAYNKPAVAKLFIANGADTNTPIVSQQSDINGLNTQSFFLKSMQANPDQDWTAMREVLASMQ